MYPQSLSFFLMTSDYYNIATSRLLTLRVQVVCMGK